MSTVVQNACRQITINMQSLKNKVALVTGGAQGIGLACAAALGNAGARVVIADVDQPAMDTAVQQLANKGVQAQSVACDVSSREQVDAAVRAAVDTFGGLDVLVANAGRFQGTCSGRVDAPHAPPPTIGIVRAADFLEMTEADFDDVIRVNLKGVFLVRRHAPHTCEKNCECASTTNLP